MVKDDPARRPLVELIDRSAEPIDPARVVEWVAQAAENLDALHASGVCHGAIGAASIEIDAGGKAKLASPASGGGERGLLLGSAPVSAARDMRDLAGAAYAILGGGPPAPEPAPIRGITVQVNLALLAALGPDAASRPATPGQFASMLRGGPVAFRPPRSPSRAPPALLGTVTALAAIVVAAALWWWVGDGPAASGEPAVAQPLLAQELVDVESRLRAEAARRDLEATAAESPPDLPIEDDGEAAPAPEPAEEPVAADPPPDPPADPPAEPASVIVNSLSQTLVLIAPGSFRMGPAPGESADDGAVRHSVRLSRGFYLGRVEVTRGQFAAFVGAAGYLTSAERAGWALGFDEAGRWQRVAGLSWRNPGFPQGDNQPAVCVSAEDAEAFCLWIGGREGRRYRLPTEAEWEYACRAGALTAWTWGDSPTAGEPRCNGADASWALRFPGSESFAWDDGHQFTSPVALFPANDWGLFDMPGNVQEWCEDGYAPYSPEDAVDPVGAAGDGSASTRVLRGGSFASPPAGCRAAERDAAPPSASLVTSGFRVALDL
jgi:formylglycine-generating enzyme required for sulfatase activity